MPPLLDVTPLLDVALVDVPPDDEPALPDEDDDDVELPVEPDDEDDAFPSSSAPSVQPSIPSRQLIATDPTSLFVGYLTRPTSALLL